MAPPKQLTTLAFLFVTIIPLVVTQPPYYFNYQPQQPQFQHPFQQFTNAPTYYQPTYQSHSPGSGSSESGSPESGRNYFTGDITTSAPPPSSPLVTFPTQVSTGATGNLGHHLSPQVYQPVGNSLYQQSPTVTTTTLADNNVPFRPSPLISQHHPHSHVVNGLPRQQFFGNNYDFFRERHGLTHIPTTSGPFLQQPRIVSSPAPALPSPTPSVLLSPTSTAQPPSKAGPPKSDVLKTVNITPAPTQATIFSRFPNFNVFSPFSSAPSPSIQTATTPTPPQVSPSARPTAQSTAGRVSPSFEFSQFFSESDSDGSNELQRQPLFGDEEEEEVEDDDSYTFNNGRNTYEEKRQQQPLFALPSPIPHQRTAAPPTISAPLSSLYKPQQPQPFNYAANSVTNSLDSSPKEETPIKIHNTTPIRIVFNYEQAVEALQENPGIRVVVAHTEKNNLTQEESTTSRPSSLYFPTSTTPRPTASQVLFQSTTARPTTAPTYRPVVYSTQRPQPPPTRFDYQYEPETETVPYSVTGRTTTTGAELENLALELEGRYRDSTRAPSPSLPPSIYRTVATYATEPTTTENSLQTYRRGGKKYVVVPGSSGNLYKAQEPRVVVNDLANIVVQTLPPGTQTYAPIPTQPSFQYTRPTYTEYETDSAGQPIGDDLQEEIENLNQQLEYATTLPPTTTTTTTTPPPPPPPRIRVTTTAPRLLKITTYRPPGTYRTTPRQAPRVVVEEEETIDEIPGNSLGQLPPTYSDKSQSPRYYYNNKERGGLSGAYQRYEYNGIENPSSPASGPQQSEEGKPLRRKRVRGRLIAGSPPRPVQVANNAGPGPVVRPVPVPDDIPAPVPVGTPLQTAPVVGAPVFRVGPKGRLLRRKSRPRAQQANAPEETRPPPSPSTFAPVPTAAAAIPDLPPVAQDISDDSPPHLPPVYSPTPFIPTSVPFSVTTFRPAPQRLLVQQNLASVDQDEDDRRVVDRPATFRSRFRFSPNRQTPARAPAIDDDNEDVHQNESEEEAPVVPQRRRPQFSTTTSTTEQPSSPQVSDRANILQRQIRFNRNKKNNQRAN